MTRRRLRRLLRGFTLVELLVAIVVLSMISILIYSAFAGMKRSREGIQRVGDRYREGRLAMDRITREISSAYVSAHIPIDQSIVVVKTAFVGTRGTPADRVDFATFSNVRRDRDAHDSDQAEISYFGEADKKQQGQNHLVRRVSGRPDLKPERGGRVEVLATDIDLFDLEYLDPLTGQWTETWDTSQATGQLGRLPLQVRVILVLNEGRRAAEGRGREPIRFTSKIAIPIQKALTFATQ
ncbi:MAG: prepilin-type N-terminal cleavage/methylation domain-containing protein [Polyangiaceae bacterium]|nr:prepilin-type N-terminal cleavage/methylation domain-containing protein [Polyangiaceae bacterium]